MPETFDKQMARAYGLLAYVIFILTSLALVAISLTLIVYAFREIWAAIATEELVESLLDAVGMLVISIAVFEVAKFLLEEQALHSERERRAPHEARQTLTKFLVIIVIAVSLETLVFIFKAGSQDFALLLYPAGLLLAVVFLIVGLGYYQRLSLETERRQKDIADRSDT